MIFLDVIPGTGSNLCASRSGAIDSVRHAASAIKSAGFSEFWFILLLILQSIQKLNTSFTFEQLIVEKI